MLRTFLNRISPRRRRARGRRVYPPHRHRPAVEVLETRDAPAVGLMDGPVANPAPEYSLWQKAAVTAADQPAQKNCGACAEFSPPSPNALPAPPAASTNIFFVDDYDTPFYLSVNPFITRYLDRLDVVYANFADTTRAGSLAVIPAAQVGVFVWISDLDRHGLITIDTTAEDPQARWRDNVGNSGRFVSVTLDGTYEPVAVPFEDLLDTLIASAPASPPAPDYSAFTSSLALFFVDTSRPPEHRFAYMLANPRTATYMGVLEVVVGEFTNPTTPGFLAAFETHVRGTYLWVSDVPCHFGLIMVPATGLLTWVDNCMPTQGGYILPFYG